MSAAESTQNAQKTTLTGLMVVIREETVTPSLSLSVWLLSRS